MQPDGLPVYMQGFALSAGLIMAIGAQNVFVLTQGARGHRPWLRMSRRRPCGPSCSWRSASAC